jgi:cyclophilin family peptidyl-prolyl cis-trans isomerase
MKNLLYVFGLLLLITSCKAVKYKDLKDGIYADIQTNKGDVLIALHAEKVPMTVANFVSLANGTNPKVVDSLKGKPYFDGIRFHRVIPDFMIQGGDPTGTGSGNAGYRFPDEFPIDSVGNLIYKHDDKGILSMANSGPKTNSSQFFITHKATPWLDRKHSIFGKVAIGQNIIDSIQKNDTIINVDIIRVGKFAKKFKAAKVFETELVNIDVKEKEYLAKLEKLKKVFLNDKGIEKAVTTNSGLKVLELKKGSGKKFNSATTAAMYYSVYLANGKLIQSIDKTKEPFVFTLDKQPMIAGVTEALKEMREGDKKRLFIPYYLGYGEKTYGPFPEKSDIIFDIELVKVGK